MLGYETEIILLLDEMDEPENIQHLREVYIVDEVDNEFPEELIQPTTEKVNEIGNSTS
jgi:hypothetical protein